MRRHRGADNVSRKLFSPIVERECESSPNVTSKGLHSSGREKNGALIGWIEYEGCRWTLTHGQAQGSQLPLGVGRRAVCYVRQCALYVLRPFGGPHIRLWIASGIEPDVAALMPWQTLGSGPADSSDIATILRGTLQETATVPTFRLTESRITVMGTTQRPGLVCSGRHRRQINGVESPTHT